MILKMNRKMQKIIKENQFPEIIDQIKLDPGLESIIYGEVIRKDGAYFLKNLIPDDYDIVQALEHLYDLTGIESYENHIHIEDHLIKSRKNNKEIIRQGIKYLYALHEILPPEEKFVLVLSVSFDPIFDCNVRFYAQRPGEVWISEDLEAYKMEALLVLEKSVSMKE